MQESLKLDPVVAEAYFQTFGLSIPVGPWASEDQLRRAEEEARKAIAGERDVLSPNEFPTDTPDGALS